MKRHLLTSFLFLYSLIVTGQQNFPREISLVFDYLLKEDYPELFKDKPYQFRPVSWQIVDIDDDGVIEVFLQTYPHYTQSPSITIFKIAKNDSVTRIIEGLAPGRLIALSDKDDYFSPHSTGTAIDVKIESSDPEKLLKFANASLKFGMSCVLYNNFIHSDKRKGKTFLDLTHLNDFPSENSCAKFQFSRPDQIIAGKVKGSENKYFIARSGDELFCYEIIGFESNVFVKKTVSIIKTPPELIKLVIVDGFIKYITKNDEQLDLIM